MAVPSYIAALNKEQIANINALIKAMNAAGLDNPAVQAGILAVVSKERGFRTGTEDCYQGTANSRIREYHSRTRALSDADLNVLKKDCKKFFNFVYNNRSGLGNDKPNDGYTYRGRGFNQITGKAAYARIGKEIGVDLVSNPDLLINPDIAAKAMIQYFLNNINSGTKLGIFKTRYNVNDVYKITDPVVAAKVFFNMNAGLGNDTRQTYWLNNTGYKKMMSVLGEMNTYAVNLKKKSPTSNLAGSFLLGVVALGLFFAKR